MKTENTIEELLEQEILPTGHFFAGYEIWKKDDQRYLLERGKGQKEGIMTIKLTYSTEWYKERRR